MKRHITSKHKSVIFTLEKKEPKHSSLSCLYRSVNMKQVSTFLPRPQNIFHPFQHLSVTPEALKALTHLLLKPTYLLYTTIPFLTQHTHVTSAMISSTIKNRSRVIWHMNSTTFMTVPMSVQTVASLMKWASTTLSLRMQFPWPVRTVYISSQIYNIVIVWLLWCLDMFGNHYGDCSCQWTKVKKGPVFALNSQGLWNIMWKCCPMNVLLCLFLDI